MIGQVQTIANTLTIIKKNTGGFPLEEIGTILLAAPGLG
jgi:hypothetical protein